MAKVLLLNGSPRAHGCTATALEEMIKTFEEEGIETELIQIGNKNIRGCIACNKCDELGKCVFDDLVNEVAQKLDEADGLVVGSPVYYSSPNGTVLSFMDRLFYSTGNANNHVPKHMKVGAAVVSCRRGGNTASFDVLNKYFSISGMPIATSTYWNQVHGFSAEDVKKDLEGLQTMRNLARSMAFMIRAFADAKEKHAMRYTHHRGLARVTNWVRLKYAAMNLKKLAEWSWKNSVFRSKIAVFSMYMPKPLDFA